MSRALGTVYNINSQIIGYFIYDGTCDLCYPAIYATKDIAFTHYRTPAEINTKCLCPFPKIKEVTLQIDYGNGKQWDGAMCTNCECIVDGLQEPHPVWSWYGNSYEY